MRTIARRQQQHGKRAPRLGSNKRTAQNKKTWKFVGKVNQVNEFMDNFTSCERCACTHARHNNMTVITPTQALTHFLNRRIETCRKESRTSSWLWYSRAARRSLCRRKTSTGQSTPQSGQLTPPIEKRTTRTAVNRNTAASAAQRLHETRPEC